MFYDILKLDNAQDFEYSFVTLDDQKTPTVISGPFHFKSNIDLDALTKSLHNSFAENLFAKYKSDRKNFIPSAEDPDRNHIRITTFGDHDITGKNTHEALVNLKKMDLLVLLGDYSYDVFDNYGLNGDDYFEWMEPVLTRAPMILTPGNHENFANTEFFLNRFMMPGTRAPLDNNFFAVHTHFAKLMQLNFDYLMMNQDSQDEAMAKVDTTLQKWKTDAQESFTYFFSHRPFHCDLHNDECVALRKQFAGFEQKLVDFPVNAFLWGHVHHYERLRPVYNEQETNCSNQYYLIVGTGGNKEDEVEQAEAVGQVSQEVGSMASDLSNWKNFILQVNYPF